MDNLQVIADTLEQAVMRFYISGGIATLLIFAWYIITSFIKWIFRKIKGVKS